MATLVIIPLPVPGHVNPTLKLARTLRAGGHRVVYCSVPDVADPLRAAGFEVEPVFASAYPLGSLVNLPSRMAGGAGALALLGLLREQVRRRDAMLRALVDGELTRVLERLRPDLLVYDEKLHHLPPIAHGLRLPAVRLHTTVPMELLTGEDGAPLRPPRPLGRRLERVFAALGLASRQTWYFEQLARAHGYPGQLDTPPLGHDGTPLPDLLLFPEAFSGAGAPDAAARRLHLGPSIDLDRREPDFPWERLREDRPLVFFSLGTLAFSSRHAPRVVRAVTEAAARRPEWQFVLAVGTALEPSSVEAGAPNVVAVQHAPQLQLLRRATAMVTHSGFNSVKECISFGVPMVAVPLQHDQPAIARLLVRHELGVRASLSELTPDTLLGLLDEITRDPAYRHALEAMRARFHEAETPEHTLAVFEQLLQSHRRPAAMAAP